MAQDEALSNEARGYEAKGTAGGGPRSGGRSTSPGSSIVRNTSGIAHSASPLGRSLVPGGIEKDNLVAPPCSCDDVSKPVISASPFHEDAYPDKSHLKGSSSTLKRLLDLDSQFSIWFHEMGLRFPRSLLQALEYSGDGLFWIPLTAAICLTPVFTAQHFFTDLLVGFLFDLMFIGTIKTLFRRPRPVYNRGMYLVVSVDHYSFPSGHSSRAFLILTFFFEYSSLWKGILVSYLKPWLKDLNNINSILNVETIIYSAIVIIVVLWAFATACSRILLGRHYVIDVVAGSCFGVLEAFIVLKILLDHQIVSNNISPLLIQTRHKIEGLIQRFVKSQ